MAEQIFEVSGADGLLRRGVLSIPQTRSDVGVVLLPAGLKYHVGPHRLNVKLAHRLCKAGYAVLRFDPLGVGESEGEIAPASIAQVWASVLSGRFVQDVELAYRTLRERHSVSTIVLLGLCGGAITAQLAAARCGGVQGVISIGTPVSIPAATGAPVSSDAVAERHAGRYMRKLLSLDAWARVTRRESDLRQVLRTFIRGVIGVLRSRLGFARRKLANENPLFIESFQALQRDGVRHLLVFGTRDNRWIEFENAIIHPHLKGQHAGRGYEVVLVPDSNHELQQTESQQQVMKLIDGWLLAHFPPQTDARHELDLAPGPDVAWVRST